MSHLPWIFTRLDLRALIDILAVASIFFWVLWVAQGTRATQLIRGLVILVVLVVGAANIFNLSALKWLLDRTLPAFIIAIPVVFQPELRRALEQLGHTGSWLRPPFTAQPETQLEHQPYAPARDPARAEPGVAPTRLSASRSASRDASAMIVSAGLALPCVGITLPSQTNRFGTSHDRWSASTTELSGKAPIRQPPTRCA